MTTFTAAALTLPVPPLPDTAVLTAAQAAAFRPYPVSVLPPQAGPAQALPDHGSGAPLECYSTDPDFAVQILTAPVQAVTARTDIGWRLHGSYLLGWRAGRRTMDEALAVAEALAAIAAAFPDEVRRWPVSQG